MHSYGVNANRLPGYMAIGLVCALLTPIANDVIGKMTFLKSLEPWVNVLPSFGFLYVVLFALYNTTTWKFSVLRYAGIPMITNLNGIYEGELTSSYKKGVVIPLRVEVVQNWTKIVVYTTTLKETSESYSYMASQFDVDGKSTRLTYSYTNCPFSAVADSDMQPHDGTANLVFRNNGQVKGTYFNARNRIGTITLKKVDEIKPKQ